MAEHDAIAASRLSTSTTTTVVRWAVCLPLLLVGGWSLYWWLQHRRRAELERSFDAKAPLRDGFAWVLGQVELEPGDRGPAIRVAITQRGRHWRGKNGWFHDWKETSREVSVRPFWVRRFDGSRVRVEPDEGVALHDALSRMQQSSQFDRVRFAELVPGEVVHVRGTLFGVSRAQDSAYRGGAPEPVLRPSRGTVMVVSTEPPGATSELRARHHKRWVLAAALLAVVVPMTVFPTATLLAFTGVPVTATPVATRHWQQWVKPKNSAGFWVQHYGVRATRTLEGRTQVLADECGGTTFEGVQGGMFPELPFVVSRLSDDVVQFGYGPQLTDGRAALLALFAVVLALVYPIAALSGRPWYVQRRVIDTGAGQLPVLYSTG